MTSSRNPTPRPRRVAGAAGGRGPRAGERLEISDVEAPPAQQVVEPVETPGAETPAPPEAVEPPAVEEVPTSAAEVSTASTSDESPDPPPARRATVALTLVIVALVAVALLQVAYLWGPLKDDPTVSADRPVLLSQAAERSAADTAAKAAVAFTQRSSEKYDEEVDAASAMMTADFEKEFRQTTDDAKQRFIEAETQVTAQVAAQGVMTASEQQVEVLIFLNQYTTKKDEEKTGVTQFRVKVTLIDTEQGWLVSDVDAT